jgi:hypothetical protein
LPKLTYSNVTASLALFIALGGTSYAISRNSVGTRELKNGAVTSAKIRNGSIQPLDLSAKAAFAGPRGPRGEPGPAGATGPPGPSEAYLAGGAATPLSKAANVPTAVAQLNNLPAGTYFLSSSAQTGDFTNGGEIVSCVISVDGASVGGSSVVVGAGAGSVRAAVISASGVVTKTAPFTAALLCYPDQSLGSPPGVSNQRLSAIRLDKATQVGS